MSKRKVDEMMGTDDEDMELVDSPSGEPNNLSIRRRHIDPSELTPKQLERVLKNRQAAQASRERKRAYVTDLEASRDRLQSEALELRTRVNVLEREKSCLADQVCQLKNEFEELKKLFLSRNSPSELVSHQHPVLPERSESKDESSFRMTSRPTAFATNVSQETSLPSTKISGQPFLGSLPPTQLPLSNRNHCQLAPHPFSEVTRRRPVSGGYPMTRNLLHSRISRPGSMPLKQVSIPRKSYGSMATQTKVPYQQIIRSHQSLTWSKATNSNHQHIKVSDLMTLLISKYQFK